MKIKCELFEIPTAPMGGVNPLPQFRKRKPEAVGYDERFPAELREELGFITKVLPYLSQDRYNRDRKNKKLKSVVLENEYLIARFLPEYGGRLHSAPVSPDARGKHRNHQCLHLGNFGNGFL